MKEPRSSAGLPGNGCKQIVDVVAAPILERDVPILRVFSFHDLNLLNQPFDMHNHPVLPKILPLEVFLAHQKREFVLPTG